MSVRFFPVPLENFLKLKSLNLGYSTESLYTTLCFLSNNYADNEEWFYRSLASLQKDTNMQKNTIIKSLKELNKHKLIEIKKDENKYPLNTGANEYKVNGFVFKSFQKVVQKTQPSWCKKRY